MWPTGGVSLKEIDKSFICAAAAAALPARQHAVQRLDDCMSYGRRVPRHAIIARAMTKKAAYEAEV